MMFHNCFQHHELIDYHLALFQLTNVNKVQLKIICSFLIFILHLSLILLFTELSKPDFHWFLLELLVI